MILTGENQKRKTIIINQQFYENPKLFNLLWFMKNGCSIIPKNNDAYLLQPTR
jgi:hypothetical protein